MPLSMGDIARIPRRQMPYKPLVFGPWPHGLNTVKPSAEIEPSELSSCLNMMALRGGRWKTRPAISKYSNSATTSNSAVKHFELCPIGSNNYELLVDDNDVLYYLNSSLDPVEIKDALEGDTTIQPFAGTAMIFDTSYIKFCDLLDVVGATKANPCVVTYDGADPSNGQSIEFNGETMTQLNGNSYTIANVDADSKTFELSGINSGAYTTSTGGGVGAIIALAYDKGTGTSGYQFDNSLGDDDTTLNLDDNNLRIAWKFTSQIWDTGYTIPPVTVTVKASKTDNVLAAGALVAVVRLASDSSVLATKNILAAATDLTTTATEYSITFASGDITNEMALSTAYYMSIEYAAGTNTNYAKIHCTTVASGGRGYHYASATWTADATEDPIISLRPGKPPKGSWGVVSDNHLIVYDPDNPGKPVFSAPGDYLNWSTATLAGYVGAIDDDANNFAVGAMVDHYGDLLIFGTKEQPYLAKLAGTSPTDWALPRLYQKVWSTHKTALSVVNDVWSASRDGVDALSGVQEYGDLRTFFASDPVLDRIEDYWDEDTAIAGYYPADGQYFLYMPTHHRVLVAHTKIPSSIQTQTGERTSRYPWTEYEFYRDIFTDSDNYKWTPIASLVTNSDMELDSNWNDHGSPSVNERSTEQVHGGTYSRKFTGLINAGIKSDTFTTVPARYTLDVWIYPVNCTAITIAARRGNDSVSYQIASITDLTANTWNNCTYSFIDPTSGAGAYVYFYGANTYYIDDVSFRAAADVDKFYLEIAAGGDPSIATEPDFLTLDGEKIETEIYSELSDHQWDYALDPSSTYYTIYFKDASGDPDVTGVKILSILTPQCLASHSNRFFMGGSDGFIYANGVNNEYKDLNKHAIVFALTPSYLEIPFGHIRLLEQQIMVHSQGGGSVNLSIYKDADRCTAVSTWEYTLNPDNALLSSDLARLFNLVTNGDMELDANWTGTLTPTVNERSSEQAKRGSYSRKFTTNQVYDGIKSDTFTVVADTEYTVVAYLYPSDGTHCRIYVRKGDDSATHAADIHYSTLSQAQWNLITFTYTEPVGGTGAYIRFLNLETGDPAMTVYVDDVRVVATEDITDITMVPMFKNMNINVRSFQPKLHNFVLNGDYPIFINGMMFKYKQLT